ncbi:MAG: glycosyltransferase [Lachnospiraceae bacterium]|nr:glycosyltransferase [Lachnospiraceae bacterium]
MRYHIDVVRVRESNIQLNGWVIGKTPLCAPDFAVLDGKKRPVDFQCTPTRRDDVSQIYFGKIHDRDFGFDIVFPYIRGQDYFLVIRCDGKRRTIRYNERLIEKRASVAFRHRERIKDFINLETLRVMWEFVGKHGLRALYVKAKHKLEGLDNDYDYGEWHNLTKPREEELAAQRETHFPYEPLISVVIPVYRTPPKYLRAMLDSVLAQTYGKFEVCVADGSGGDAVPATADAARRLAAGETTRRAIGAATGQRSPTEAILAEYAGKDSRVRYVVLESNLGIAGNTNAAMALAAGDYIALADHDDEMAPDALYEVAKAINAHPGADVIYTDEDKLDMDGKALFDPHFKPDFNIDLLASVNYICHLFVVRRGMLREMHGAAPEGADAAATGGIAWQESQAVYMDPAYDGAQDYDFILRCCERAGAVVHIPKALYHWRCHRDSTAANPASKMYAFEAGARAVKAHFDRVGISVLSVEKGVDYGIYHTRFQIIGQPLISIIIPNKDHCTDLDLCIRSIMGKATYRNFEILVVENNSTEQETFDYYRKIQEEFPGGPGLVGAGASVGVPGDVDAGVDVEAAAAATGYAGAHEPGTAKGPGPSGPVSPCVRVVEWKPEAPAFNFPAINNYGARAARGEYFLFLNNDTEVIAPPFLEEMLGYCQRPDVGAVGARLLYRDGTIQHAGVVVGFGGIAGHTFIGLHEAENSYFHRAMCAQDYSAVTAACMMTKGDVFFTVGGFSEELAVAFNDIDYCMKVRSSGKLVVYNPYAALWHYESKSRGLEDTPEKVARFNREVAIFAGKWPDILRDGDPYYNPNLTLRKSNFALKDLKKEKIGEPYPLPGAGDAPS